LEALRAKVAYVLQTGPGFSTGSLYHPDVIHLTFLFTDLEGSTHILQTLAGRYVDTISRYYELLRNAVAANGGREIDARPDSFFAVFDRASSAVVAAAMAQQAIAKEPWPRGGKVRVRMGLHTGLAKQESVGLVGLDVHIAARICAAANGGQVLLSGSTRRELADEVPKGVALRELGTHRLKDIRFPEALFDLVIAGLPSRFPPIRSMGSRPNNLPSALSTFVGRAVEKARVHQYLQEPSTRAVTLVGPGGAGKTRLAIEVAGQVLDRFGDGVHHIPLAGISSPRLIGSSIAQSLGLPEAAGRPVLDILKHAIGEKHILILLDDFEHLMTGKDLLMELLEACPRLTLLITSREPLGFPVEREIRVEPFCVPHKGASLTELRSSDAIRLFTLRAREIRPDLAFEDEALAVTAEICRKLDGLPLAIELAASRLMLLNPSDLLARLASPLNNLGHDSWGLGPRHETLRNTIAWSYNLLPENERKVFCRTSVFVGGFDIHSAQKVCSQAAQKWEVLDAVTSLVRKSLLTREIVNGEPRVRMLDTIREYGIEQLEVSGEYSEFRWRHLRYILDLTAEAAPHLVRENQRSYVTKLLLEMDNIRSALDFALDIEDVAAIAQLLKSLLWLWIPRGQFSEGGAWIARGLATAQRAPGGQEHAQILDVAGWMKLMAGDWVGAAPLFEACWPIYERAAMTKDAALASMLQIAASSPADLLAGDKISEKLTFFECLGDTESMGVALTALGEIARLREDYSTAQHRFEAALTCMRRSGNTYWIGALLENLAAVSLQFEDWRAAEAHLREALELAREYDDPLMTSYYVAGMGTVATLRGFPEEAARLFGAATTNLTLMGVRLEPADKVAFEKAIATTRSFLGLRTYEERFREGAQWSIEQAITTASGLHTNEPSSHLAP
jgi:predicted ATPase/class 3 adenylate cyclase